MLAPAIRIALLDDHQILLGAMASFLRAQPGIEVVATASDCDEGLRQILETRPDVAVLDVDLPGRGSFDIALEISSRLRSTRVLFLTGFLSDVLLDQALRLRASGYILKGEPLEVVVSAIRQIAAGQQCFSSAVQERLAFDPERKRYTLHTAHPLSQLTPRQLEVLRHLARGESVKEVAKTMHLSQKSVDSHKYRIMHKLGIHDRVQLARYAIREGLTLP